MFEGHSFDAACAPIRPPRTAVYAPLQREGHFPDSQHGPRGQGAVPEPFAPQTLPALDGLMASVPRRMLVPKLQIPCPPAKLSYRERQVGQHKPFQLLFCASWSGATLLLYSRF